MDLDQLQRAYDAAADLKQIKDAIDKLLYTMRDDVVVLDFMYDRDSVGENLARFKIRKSELVSWLGKAQAEREERLRVLGVEP